MSPRSGSQLYMALALLQGADVVILDESLAALDYETLQLAMKCALQRARTLVSLRIRSYVAVRCRPGSNSTTASFPPTTLGYRSRRFIPEQEQNGIIPLREYPRRGAHR